MLCVQQNPDILSNLLNSSYFSLELQRYLLQQDSKMYAAAKAQIEECCEKSKSGDPQFRCIYTSMKARLRSTVGEFHWKKAHDYLDHLMKHKRVLPKPASAPTNATCKPTTTAVSAPPVNVVDLTSKKKGEALKRKELPNLQVLDMHATAKKLKKGAVHASKGLVEMPPTGGLSTVSTTTTPLSIALDFFAAKSNGDATKNSRKMFREEFSINEAARRDHDCDNPSFDVSSKDDRGVRATNEKFAERYNQREMQLYHQQYDVEVRKLDSVLRSKGGQCDARIQLAHLHNTLGDTDKAKLELEQVSKVISAITKIEDDLMQLKNKRNHLW